MCALAWQQKWMVTGQMSAHWAELTYRAVVKHAVKDGAVCLPHWAQIEAPHLQQVLVLVVWRHAVQEVHILCSACSC